MASPTAPGARASPAPSSTGNSASDAAAAAKRHDAAATAAREEPYRRPLVDAASAEIFASVNPATGEVLAEIEHRRRRRRSSAPSHAAQAGTAVVGAHDRRASAAASCRRAADLLRARNEELARARDARHRQADPGDIASSTCSRAPTASSISPASPPALAGEHVDLGPAAFGYTRREPLGRRRRHRRLELPAADRLLEIRAGARLRQRHDLQARRADPAHGAQARRDLPRGRACPTGVFRWCRGCADTGRLLTRHPRIRKVSLTGEVGTGKAVMADAAADAQAGHARARRQVAAHRVRGCQARQRGRRARCSATSTPPGEVCSNGTRVFVHASVRGAFLERLARAHRAHDGRRPAGSRRPRSGALISAGAHGQGARLHRARPCRGRAPADRRRHASTDGGARRAATSSRRRCSTAAATTWPSSARRSSGR